MWLIVAPLFAVLFGSYAFSRVVKNRTLPTSTDENDDDVESEIVVITEMVDAEDDAVVSDVIGWLEEASERLEISTPIIMQVGASKFLKFSSKTVELNLWLCGEEYLGPFPRLSLSGDTKHPGICIERTALDLEKAVIELRS